MRSELLFRPEFRLLLACCRRVFDAEASERIRKLADGEVDWACVVDAASEHGIRPLLYRNLSTVRADIVPPAILQALRVFSLENAGRNLVLAAEVLRLAAGLKDRRIDAVQFKGPVLGDWAFGDVGLRESSDLDLIVRKKHLQEAASFLCGEGYRRRSGELQGSFKYNIFKNTDAGITVDLQASLEAPHFSFDLGTADIWNRVTSRRFMGQVVSTFSPEDFLILLCVHGVKDVWFQLKWLCDVAEIINNETTIDWNRLTGYAVRLRARRKFLVGALLAKRLLDSRVPEEIANDALRDPKVVGCADRIAGRLFGADRSFRNSERAALYFQTDDTVWEQLKRCLPYGVLGLRIVFVPTQNDRAFRRLPGLSIAAFLVRPVRLLLNYGLHPRLALRELRKWLGFSG
jgi:hypothetical protein